MNEGIHLDLDTWIVPGQIRKMLACGISNSVSASVVGAGAIRQYPWVALAVAV